MKEQFRATDPRGRTVICAEDRWSIHVLATRPFMEKQEASVVAAIEKPDVGILQDKDYPEREIYYRFNKKKHLYIKVVIEFKDNVGALVTAHPADGVKKGEKLIWTYKL